MKLTEKQVSKYIKDFHIELSEEQLKHAWHFDRNFGFQTVNSVRMINLKSNEGNWLRISFSDLEQQQIEELINTRMGIMTPEEKAYELSKKYAAPKNKNRERAVYESSLEMFGWFGKDVCKWLEENLGSDSKLIEKFKKEKLGEI